MQHSLTHPQNNANEGSLFVPTNIVTLSNLTTWLKDQFSTLFDDQVTRLLDAYASTDDPVNPTDLRFATSGLGPATAVNVSQIATGQQQRAFVSPFPTKS